jgi:tRNA (uracil-5-)-methyltransferase
MPCDVLEPIPSSVVDGYRTKCEFTIGTNLDGKPTVGFLLGSFRDGVVTVLDLSESLNVPSIAKKIAKDMEEYVNASE